MRESGLHVYGAIRGRTRPRRPIVQAASALGLAGLLAGCPAPDVGDGADVCDQPGTICTVAGTGQSLFDGDGKDALQTSLYHPLDVVFDEAGRPLILDWNNFRVRRINDDGSVETIIGQDFEASPIDGALAIDTALHHASDIERDQQGRYILAGYHVPLVFVIDRDSRVHVVAGNGEFGYTGDNGPALQASLDAPFGVFPTADGGFYLADQAQHVARYVDAAGIIRTVAGDGARGYAGDGGPAVLARLANPTRLRVGPDGALYICDTGNHCIRRVAPEGVISTFAGSGRLGYSGDGGPAAAARLNTPYDIAFAPNGDLYVADTGNSVIRRVDSAGIITTVVGSGTAGFSGDGAGAGGCQLNRASGVTFGPDGAMWISDTYNNRVRRVAEFLAP